MSDSAELIDLYARLHNYLPAGTLKPPEDNAAAYVSYVDPRKAPINVEVFDLIREIEAAWAAELDDDEMRATFPRLIYRARLLTGQIAPPVRVSTPCPVCGCPTIFRTETADGMVAACCNPDCRDEEDRRHQWTEQEWQDKQDHLRRSSTISERGEHLG